MSDLATLKRQGGRFAHPEEQVKYLSSSVGIEFESKLKDAGLYPLNPTGLDVLQLNLGKMCNQVCKHCHVDAGPDRREKMSKQTLIHCLDVLRKHNIKAVDLTGGAPEMHPDFRWFVEQIRQVSPVCTIIVRCNLTIILANKKYNDLPIFFKQHKVQVVSSLPSFAARRTDAQRGDGVFEKSIAALKLLNEVGYGVEDHLELNLVYNPTGTFLPAGQEGLEQEFKTALRRKFGIEFHQLFTITNIPISRFLEYLVLNEKYEEYLSKLVEAYNPLAAAHVMCRNMVSVSWDGYLYDCDFNQMLDLKIDNYPHISEFNVDEFLSRDIKVNKHCFGCTAGAGSSCGGEVA